MNFSTKKIILCFLLFVTVFYTNVTAQKTNLPLQKYTISGTITDKATGETLLGASILIAAENKGVVSNEYGFYSITLPKGAYKLNVAYMGYETIRVAITLEKNTKKNIALTAQSNTLEEIVIENSTAPKRNSHVKGVFIGVATLKKTDIEKLPAFMGEPDITRALLTQPGISSNGEGTSGFNVRGGNIDQNLILLDEAPLYNSSHLWGFFSAFNSNAIKDLKLYKGGIPARFGGRASSVLDIRQNEGNDKKFTGEGGVGTLFSKITLQGPIVKEKLSFLVSGRRSYFDLFFPLDKDLKNTKVYFYDLNTKVKWKIDEKNKLFFSGYFGADVMKFKFDSQEEEKEDGSVESSSSQGVNFSWRNSTATLRWNHIFSDRLFMNISAIYSLYNYSLTSENTKSGGPTDKSGSFVWDSTIENWIMKPDFTLYLTNGEKIRFGINNTLYLFSPAKVSNPPNASDKEVNDIDFQTEKGLEIAPYVSFEKKWDKFTMNTGLRWSWFGNIGAYEVANYEDGKPKNDLSKSGATLYKRGDIIKSYNGLEPRINLKYALTQRKAIKMSYNRMFQYVHLISNTAAALPFDIWKMSGRHIKPLETNQIALGYAYDTPKSMYSFSAEGYYKTFKNIVDYKDGANLFLNKDIETELLNANGFSYGLETSIYKNEGRLQGNISYTYSVTRRKIVDAHPLETINEGDYYPSNFDRPHILNVTLNYDLSKKWKVNAFFTYQTGRPNTDPTGRYTVGEKDFLIYNRRNNGRLGDTHRLDISFTYEKFRPSRTVNFSWSFGAYNVYARKNPFSRYYGTEGGFKLLQPYRFSVVGSIIPFVNVNFKF